MTTTFELANEHVRQAVQQRREAQAAGKPSEEWYSGCSERDPVQDFLQPESCCEGQRLRGDSLLASDVHPTSQAFFDLCDALKEMHRRKSSDYGCPSGTDPLANIRNGAKFVVIPAWKGAMVRLSDKVTRLATYNATGKLENESLEDNLFDLASYSLLALLLHREERGE